ncbi:MAG: DUF3179 domain-containing protein [Anaerolineae bacterium]|nr:DUF3179 domain-containing protein [Anaerolineae bacterium]
MRKIFGMLICIILLTACQNPPTLAATAVPPTHTPSLQLTLTPVTAVPPLSDDLVAEYLNTYLLGSQEEAQATSQAILAANDQRFVAVFIELLYFRRIGLPTNRTTAEYAADLGALTDQSFGEDVIAWMEWYGNTELVPPPGFTEWKGVLFSTVDPRFVDFFQEAFPARLRVEEIQWGGVRVDGIPALDNPTMLTPAEATYLQPEDTVFGLSFNGDARAYPLRIMDWHEMANDVVGGIPVSLAYCTLCGAAVAYDGRASNGNTYTFGSSGLLYRSNKLMYDRQTGTLWNQLTGEPVLGTLAAEDVRLDILPVVLTTWADWLAQHPDSKVADINTGFPRDYAPGAAYAHYFSSPETMFPVAQRSDLLEAKAQIYALRLDDVAKAYPLASLMQERVVNDVVGETAVLLIAASDLVEVTGRSRLSDTVTYSNGTAVRAYERGENSFVLGVGENEVLDGDGRVWQITEEALIGPKGETLPRLGGHLAYWFGWYAFFPDTLVYGK